MTTSSACLRPPPRSWTLRGTLVSSYEKRKANCLETLGNHWWRFTSYCLPPGKSKIQIHPWRLRKTYIMMEVWMVQIHFPWKKMGDGCRLQAVNFSGCNDLSPFKSWLFWVSIFFFRWCKAAGDGWTESVFIKVCEMFFRTWIIPWLVSG